MNKIDSQIQKIKTEKRLGLMTHVIVGYPSLSKTISLVKEMEKAGVDFVELQIPFSDPLADGPVIMRACEESLKKGTKVKDSFLLMEKLSREVNIPLIFMTYFNTVFKYGTEKFCRNAKKVGASGLIIPDMPIEEEKCEHFIKYCLKYGLKHIRVVSPASTKERLVKNAKIANGFVYFAARQGITGVKKTLDSNIVSNLKKLRKYFSVPIAVGFGISRKEHFRMLKPYADIVVIGSAIINIINSSLPTEIEKNVGSFLKHIKMVD